MMALQESTTRILFTEDGKPIEGLEVRLGERVVETDSFGQVELSLSEGHQSIDVKRNGDWISHVIEATPDSSLIIVDLVKRETDAEREEEKSKSKVSFLDIGKLNLGDRYIYEEVIGRGGMSVVLKARDRLLNRDVAIKLLSQELQAQSEAQNVFLTEARNLARLSHPNLVAVHDICKVEDQVFMVIEFIEGESLGNLIDTVKGFNETVALQTIIQLSRVVGYLHAHGIIHRDLKPANAMIRNDGTLKLIDFGLARHFDELNMRGTRVRGTPAYMSPEQIRGDKLTPACDVYQLGVCMFEVVTGKLPFYKGDVSYSHCHDAPPRANELNEDISEALTELIGQCLNKDPAVRPPDGQALLKQLQTIYQAQDAASGNILDQLRKVERGEQRTGYSNSEIEMMEGAGKHLRTSDFAAEQISKILSDPNLQSKIVIERESSNHWFPIMGGILGGMIFAGGLWLATDAADRNPEHRPARVTSSTEDDHEASRSPDQNSVSDSEEPRRAKAASQRVALDVRAAARPILATTEKAPAEGTPSEPNPKPTVAEAKPTAEDEQPTTANETTANETTPNETNSNETTSNETTTETSEKSPSTAKDDGTSKSKVEVASTSDEATSRSGGRDPSSHEGSPGVTETASKPSEESPESELDDMPNGFLH